MEKVLLGVDRVQKKVNEVYDECHTKLDLLLAWTKYHIEYERVVTSKMLEISAQAHFAFINTIGNVGATSEIEVNTYMGFDKAIQKSKEYGYKTVISLLDYLGDNPEKIEELFLKYTKNERLCL